MPEVEHTPSIEIGRARWYEGRSYHCGLCSRLVRAPVDFDSISIPMGHNDDDVLRNANERKVKQRERRTTVKVLSNQQ